MVLGVLKLRSKGTDAGDGWLGMEIGSGMGPGFVMVLGSVLGMNQGGLNGARVRSVLGMNQVGWIWTGVRTLLGIKRGTAGGRRTGEEHRTLVRAQ
jgi:hypothetical protein